MSAWEPRGRGRGMSTYTGLRLTVVQPPHDGPLFLTVSVKQPEGGWDEWQLLFPALRLPPRPMASSGDVLALVAEAVEHLLEQG